MDESDWSRVAEIYAAGMATGHATFEDATPTWSAFDSGRLHEHRLVAAYLARGVLGWVAAAAVSDRCVYAGVIEVSVYVDPTVSDRGIGRLLLDAFVASTEAAGIWTVQAGVFPENLASLALHRAAGFRDVGVRHRLGLMTYGPAAGRWRDVILLERRSDVAGIAG